jgi:hypothetical protein
VTVSLDLYPRILAGAMTRIQELDLTSGDPNWQIAPDSVYRFDRPTLDNVVFPCVQLTNEGEREEALPGTTEHFDWLWPVRVFLMDRDPGTDLGRRDAAKSWRRQIIAAFQDQRLTGVDEVKWCYVEPVVIYDPQAIAYQLVVGSCMLKFWTRERRN